MFTLGVVPYLNAVPLTAALEGRAQILADVPSRLTPWLAEGRVDAALLPVYEALQGVGDGFLGNYGIASRGAVGSVLLFLRRPLREARTLVLAPASRSSAGLARWLLARRAPGPLRISTAKIPGPDPAQVDADAVLLIGDPALAAARRWSGAILDLGQAWTEETGLPFVYARWTAREGLDAGTRRELEILLDEAAAAGLANRADLARAWAEARQEDAEAAARYVLQNVWYRLGRDENAGLARYAEILRTFQGPGVREAGHA